MVQRHIIIGDVHGMSEELALLMSDVRPTSKDIVVFVGDLVDKGPDSAGVVRWLEKWQRMLALTWLLLKATMKKNIGDSAGT